MRRPLGAAVSLAPWLLASCLEPSSIRVAVFTDLDCAAHPQVVVVGGSGLGELANRAPSATSSSCDAASGRVGDVVVLPSDGDVVAFAVVTRLGGEPSEECVASVPPKGCIVARRQLRFIAHKAIEMRVDLRGSCANVVCPQDQTCVLGGCVSAQIADCEHGCSEGALLAPGALPNGPPTWQPVASLPTPRHSAGAALAGDGRIYVAGGVGAAGATAVTEVYDPQADAWSTTTALPAPNESLAAAAGLDGRVYLFGGRVVRAALAFDVATRAWTPLAALPTGRAFTRAATGPDGRIYVIGGDNLQATADLKVVEAFDPKTSSWQARASLPTGRGNLAVASGPDGRIYAFGGDSVTTPGTGRAFDDNEVLDTTTNTWRAAARLPEAASGLYAALGADGRIYVNFGKTIRAYSPARDAWEPVVAPRSEHSGGSVVRGPDGRVYVIGGRTSAGPGALEEVTAVVEAYGPVVEVSPTAGPPGRTVHVGGSNFAPYARVSVTLDDVTGPALAVGQTDAYGALSPPVFFEIPGSVTPGAHAVIAVDDRSQFPVRRTVTVQ